MSVLVSEPRGVFVTSLVSPGPISEQFLPRRVTLTMREISLDISIEIGLHVIKKIFFLNILILKGIQLQVECQIAANEVASTADARQ